MATQIRGSFILSIGCVFYGAFPCFAQVTDGAGTALPVVGNVYTITTGQGQLSSSGNNLFHNFRDFRVNASQTVDFQSTATIANIFARISGGNASYIDGLVKVSNGTSNLFLINPAGILTGVTGRIEVPGSFTATTADRIGFAGGFLDVLGSGFVVGLEGAPTAFQFSLTTPGIIVNEGLIKVGPNTSTTTSNGQEIRLIAGTVLNTGFLTVPEGTSNIAPGKIEIVAVNGPATVSFAASGSVIQPGAGAPAPLLTLQLPSTLLQGRVSNAASQITVAADRTVRLVGAPVDLGAGDVAIAGTDNVSIDFQPAGQGLVSNGGLFINASGQVKLASVQISDDSNLGSGGTLPMRAPIVVQAGDAIQTGNLGTKAGDIRLNANSNIFTGKLSSGGQLDSNNQSRIKLISPSGDIQVDSLDSGSGGILVQAGQSFRALGLTRGASGGGQYIIDDPGLTDYLVSLGYNRQDIDNADLKLGSSAQVSIIARPSNILRNTGDAPLLDGYKAPIVIQYGDRQQTLVDSVVSFNNPTDRTGRILIQGDSQQAFRMGLAYDGRSPFVLNSAGNPIPRQNPTTSPNVASLTNLNGGYFSLGNGRLLEYGATEFPATASGLVGGIQVGAGTDSSLYSSVQVRSFDPPTPTPTPAPTTGFNPQVMSQIIQVRSFDSPIIPPNRQPQPNPQPNPQRNNSSALNCSTPLTGQAQSSALAPKPSDKPSSDKRSDDRATTLPQPIDPCQKPQQDDTLFKLLYENPNVQGIQELTPADIKQKR